MKQYPSVPSVEDPPSGLFESGHLWIQEQVDAAHFRFRLRDSGVLQFGDRTRVFDADEVPEPYKHAVRHVRERFDREALRDARDDVESVVFFGVATHRHVVDYDWNRMPSFLGFDVWDGDERSTSSSRTASAADADEDGGHFLPPDAVEQVYERLGLRPVNVLRKEVRATDFDPASYEIPQSEWYDGPAAGVVIRNKTGQRATLPHPDFRGGDDPGVQTADDDVPANASAEELAREYATRERVETVARTLEDRGHGVTFDAVYERVVEAIVREKHGRLFDGESAVDVSAFRSEVAARVQEFLDS